MEEYLSYFPPYPQVHMRHDWNDLHRHHGLPDAVMRRTFGSASDIADYALLTDPDGHQGYPSQPQDPDTVRPPDWVVTVGFRRVNHFIAEEAGQSHGTISPLFVAIPRLSGNHRKALEDNRGEVIRVVVHLQST